MIRDITIGQYYPGESWVHRLDARIKIIISIMYIIQLFIAKDFLGFILAVAALAVTIGIAGVPMKFILKGLKPIFLIIVVTFILNMLMISGNVLIKLWIFKVS